jgi:aspartate racemase
MKTIGLLGGMSWESSALYYQLINELVRDRMGGLHSAKIVMASVDFAEIEEVQRADDWARAGELLAAEAANLEAAGADFLVLCTNTMHKVAPAIEAATTIPLLHLADATATAVMAANIHTVGLLGTAFTMEQDFYKDRLTGHGLTVIVPNEAERAIVHRIIYTELVLGIVEDSSRAEYRAIIASLCQRGAEGIILGCTEIELLVSASDSPVRVFPTTRIHAEAAVREALDGPAE